MTPEELFMRYDSIRYEMGIGPDLVSGLALHRLVAEREDAVREKCAVVVLALRNGSRPDEYNFALDRAGSVLRSGARGKETE